MVSVIKLLYNPFIPRLNITINDQHLSEFSQLIQYTDEDIFKWVPCICETIYSEVKNDYLILFTGTESDAAIFRVAAKKNEHCISFKHIPFPIDTPVNQRMIALQKYISTNNISQFAINKIGYHLFVEEGIGVDECLIKSKMSIRNRFCVVSEANKTDSEVYDFVIATSKKRGLSIANGENHTFIIIIGERNELIDVEENCLYYSATEDTVLKTIYICLLSFPLTIALRNTYSSIKKELCTTELKMIVAVDPVVTVALSNQVELGRTATLIVNYYPNNLNKPKLLYKIQNPSIASCNGIYVSGKSVGQTKLEIYKTGETIPIETIDISVIQRNRIKDLFLSAEELMLGLGDLTRVSVDYSPEDADNTDTIKWESTDSSIVVVSKGRLQAVGVGNCRIICTAENVSAQCVCTVKEYLKDIIVQPYFEENRIEMTPMEEIDLCLQKKPSDVVDGDLFVSSSDSDIVNCIGNKLVAKNTGNAQIIIYNRSQSVVKTFSVAVVPSVRTSGFLQKLKQFIGIGEI